MSMVFTCKRRRGLRCSAQTRTRWPRPLWFRL